MASEFTIAADNVIVENTAYDTIIDTFENGKEQRRPRRSVSDKVWTLAFTTRAIADYNTVKSLFDSKLGAYTSFTWTNPLDSTEYTVRFVQDSLSVSHHTYGIVDFSVTLKKVS
jgi:phage-related protein